MESLDSTDWDVLIAGTGIQESLLALALSKSNKKILHIDQNGYYGDAEAAMSLQEAQDWAETTTTTDASTFSKAAISTTDTSNGESSSSKLGFSRAYSLALAPHIVYTRSSLLPLLVSSRSDQQLEFLAVGSWFVYTSAEDGSPSSLTRVPSSREDLFADQSIEARAKRSLMKFLRFVGDFENQSDWQAQAQTPFHDFLSSRFGLPQTVQAPFLALTLSPYASSMTTTAFALPRIARHLRSIGLFGPGFGAVVPKWGGLAEIAQVGCRAGAVGGAVYVLGTGIAQKEQRSLVESKDEDKAKDDLQHIPLTNGDNVKTKWLVGSEAAIAADKSTSIPLGTSSLAVSRSIAIISSPLKALFPPLAEGAPQPAVAVVVFPRAETPPLQLFIHSSETGECPAGQSIIYASIATPSTNGFAVLDDAITSLLSTLYEPQMPQVLWKMQYEQRCSEKVEASINDAEKTVVFSTSSPDLAFDDEIIEQVRRAWAQIVDGEEGDGFLRFAAREDVEPLEDDL